MLYIYTYLGLGLGRYFHSERCRRDFGVVHLCTYFKETDEGKVAMKSKLLPTLPFKLKLKLKIDSTRYRHIVFCKKEPEYLSLELCTLLLSQI